MKKHLLSTSAIALGVVAAAPASAQDWNLDWGGYISTHVAIVDHGGNTGGTDFDGLKTFAQGEIIFSPSITLDNGLTFGVNVQMEAQNSGGGADGIDETYIEIKGDSFGRLVIGSENSAGYLLSTGAPTVSSMYVNSPSISAFLPLSGVVPFNFRQAGVSAFSEVAGNNDVNRITYFTPSFNGLTVGVSYAPNNNCNATASFGPAGQCANNSTASLEDIWDIGVGYSGSFGTSSVTASARYGEGSGVGGLTDADVWQVGLNVGFGDFSVGGSYGENDNGNGSQGVDQEGWSFGVSYDAPGPWAFSAETYQGEYTGSGFGGANEDYKAYQIAASRDIGPGVDWDIYVVYAEAEDGGLAANDTDGTVLGTALNLSF